MPCPCPMLPAMSARSYWHRGGGKDARKRRRRARAAVSELFAARQLARMEEDPLHAEEEGAFSESTCSPPSQETAAAAAEPAAAAGPAQAAAPPPQPAAGQEAAAAAPSFKAMPVARSPNPVWMPPQPPCSVLPPGAGVPMVPFTGPVMGQPVAQAPPVTDDLQVALRKALHDQLDILKAVHEKNKANAKVTETLRTHVDSQKEASSSKKQTSSWKPPEASSSKKQKPFWRPPRFCYACHMRTYLGAGHGCANTWCPSVRPQGPARSWSSNSWQWQADDQSASAKRANQGEQDQPSAEQAEAGGSGGVWKEEEETYNEEGKGGWQFGQPWSLWGRSNPEGERQQDEEPQDESKQAEDWPQASGQQQQHHQSGTSAISNWWGGGSSSQPSGGSG